MIRLTYISTALQGLPETTTRDIVDVSRINNRRCNVTGLLISDGVRFLQAIEGGDAAVDATFERIQADPRHRACVLLDRGPVTARAFAGWDMAWQPLIHAVTGATLRETVAALTSQIADRSLRALFSGFLGVDRSAA
jgi:hypothetical protein